MISKEVGKIAHKLREEINQLGEHTDTLENKFDELVQYVHALEKDNAALKHTMSQLKVQRKDLVNREWRQNLRIRGVPETVSAKEIHPYLQGIFNTLVPHIPDIDWRQDRDHRSLASKPPPNANSRDIIVHFHYHETKEALKVATRNKTHLDFKGDKIQIFSDLSPITLAKRQNLHPIISHLQQLRVIYCWGFPLHLSASTDGSNLQCIISERGRPSYAVLASHLSPRKIFSFPLLQ